MNNIKDNICFKDLLLYIFKRWFVFLITIIIFGGLFGIFLDKLREQGKTNTDRVVEYGMSDSEIGEVYDMIQTYYANKKKYEEVYEYCNTSVIQNLDPYNIPEVTCMYKIDSDNEDVIKTICQKYCLELMDADTYDLIREKTGWTYNNDVISELISIDYDMNQYSGLVITVRSTSQDECKILMEIIDKRLNDSYRDFAHTYTYSINKDGERIRIVADPSLGLNQSEIIKSSFTYKQYINGGASYLASAAQKEYYSFLIDFSNRIISEGLDIEYIKAVEEARYKDLVALLKQRVSASENKGKEPTEETSRTAYFNMKNMVIGAIFGFLLSVIFLVLRYIQISSKLAINNNDKEK